MKEEVINFPETASGEEIAEMIKNSKKEGDDRTADVQQMIIAKIDSDPTFAKRLTGDLAYSLFGSIKISFLSLFSEDFVTSRTGKEIVRDMTGDQLFIEDWLKRRFESDRPSKQRAIEDIVKSMLALEKD